MHLPPLGIPEKYQVKVVTLDEPPFVIVSEMDPTTNKCPTKQGVQCQWGYVDGSKLVTVINLHGININSNL